MKKILLNTAVFFSIGFTALLLTNKTYAKTFTVCEQTGAGCDQVGGDGIQKAVDNAIDGDTVFIKTGKYISAVNKPCFLDLGAKKLTIEGEGSPIGAWNGTVLYGEGHSKPDVYPQRAALCSTGGDVTIKNIHIREFQGGGLKFTSSRLVLYRSVIDTNDAGGITLNDSSALIVNTIFLNDINRNGQQPIKAINNTIIGKAIDGSCNENVGPLDFINNIVKDPELTIGLGLLTGNCPDKVAQYGTKNITYNIFWKENHPCYPNHEFCDFTQPNNAKKNLNADPLLKSPAPDASGWAPFGDGNFDPGPGSPALGTGSPGIPNANNELGAYGGPCVEPESATCTQFITANIPALPEPPQPPPQIQNNNQNNGNTNVGNNGTLGIPLPTLDLGNSINFPHNDTIPNNFAINTRQLNDDVMNVWTYVFIAIAYIIVMHFAINMGSEFSLGLMIVFFVLGAIIGGWLHTYESGFAGAAILSLLFIGGPKKEM